MSESKYTIGIDEVGRGALAGPVFVGAVRLPLHPEAIIQEILEEAKVKTLKDSKKHTAAERERIYAAMKCKVSSFAFGWGQVEEINSLGLVPTLTLAAGRALRIVCAIRPDPDLVELRADAGLHHPFEKELPTQWYVKGDEKFPEIALASIVAKVARDEYMHKLAATFPEYNFAHNVGYGTLKHRQALTQYGATAEHRDLFIRNIMK